MLLISPALFMIDPVAKEYWHKKSPHRRALKLTLDNYYLNL